MFLLDNVAALRRDVILSLQTLQLRGSLTGRESLRDGGTGRLRSQATSIRGPVAVMGATAETSALDDSCILVELDDSPAQTARQVAARQRDRQGQGLSAVERQQRVTAWQALWAALAPMPVRMPFADRIVFPMVKPEHRRDHERFLSLIEASALLHQHQRQRLDGFIIATEADFTLACRAATGVLGETEDAELAAHRPLLEAFRAAPEQTLSLTELHARLPQRSRVTLWRDLGDLVRLDVLMLAREGRGRRGRRYRLAELAIVPAGTIRLASPGENDASHCISSFHCVSPGMKRESRVG
jgi:hypothetical protein